MEEKQTILAWCKRCKSNVEIKDGALAPHSGSFKFLRECPGSERKVGKYEYVWIAGAVVTFHEAQGGNISTDLKG